MQLFFKMLAKQTWCIIHSSFGNENWIWRKGVGTDIRFISLSLRLKNTLKSFIRFSAGFTEKVNISRFSVDFKFHSPQQNLVRGMPSKLTIPTRRYQNIFSTSENFHFRFEKWSTKYFISLTTATVLTSISQ